MGDTLFAHFLCAPKDHRLSALIKDDPKALQEYSLDAACCSSLLPRSKHTLLPAKAIKTLARADDPIGRNQPSGYCIVDHQKRDKPCQPTDEQSRTFPLLSLLYTLLLNPPLKPLHQLRKVFNGLLACIGQPGPPSAPSAHLFFY